MELKGRRGRKPGSGGPGNPKAIITDNARLGISRLEAEPGLGDALIDSIETGLFDKQIACLHKVHPQTLKSWLDKGLSEDAVEPFKTFATRYLQKQADVEVEAVQSIRNAGKPASCPEEKLSRGDWKATAWWLERWRPMRWGPNIIGTSRDAYVAPELTSRQKRAEDVFRNPTPDLLKAVAAAGKMLVDKVPVVETTGETVPDLSHLAKK